MLVTLTKTISELNFCKKFIQNLNFQTFQIKTPGFLFGKAVMSCGLQFPGPSTVRVPLPSPRLCEWDHAVLQRVQCHAQASQRVLRVLPLHLTHTAPVDSGGDQILDPILFHVPEHAPELLPRANG